MCSGRPTADKLATELAKVRAECTRKTKALEATAERFRLLIENVTDIVSVLEADSTIRYESPACEHILGYPPGERVGTKAFEHVHPDDLDRILTVFQASVPDAHATPREEVRFRHKDGSWRVLECVGRNLLHDERFHGAIITSRDISERKEAEEALRSESSRAQQYLDVAGVMFLALDSDGKVTLVNRRGCEILGYDEPEILGKNWFTNFLPEAIRDEVQAVFGKVMAGKLDVVEYYENPILTKDGRERTIAWHNAVLTDEAGRFAGTIGSGEDITERKQAEDALRESEERFRHLAELLPQTVFETDLDGRLTFCNLAAFPMFGYSQEDYHRGANCLDMVVPEDRPRAMANIRRVLAGEDIGSTEYTAARRDGTTFPIIMHSTVIVRDGEPQGLRGILFDITDRRQLEDELRQSQKMEAIGRLAGGVAHDFNNLLTAINGYSEMALAALDPDNRVTGYIAEVKKAGKRAAALTTQLLAFSRRQILQPEVIDLDTVVKDMEMMLRRVIGEDIVLTSNFADDLCTVEADPGQIQQVLLNLAVNARDAMPRGGQLTIETRNADLAEANGHTHHNANPGLYAVLSVTDNGPGMDDATLARAFEPFFTTKSAGKGTGLGLATVHGIVEQSGGHVRVHSHPGRGTRFEIWLPARNETASCPNTLPPAKAPAQPPRAETILVVEDESMIRELAHRILDDAGYDILTAADGDEAIRLAAQHADTIDLMLTDVVLPGISGHELAKRLSTSPHHTPVLYMSGYTDGAIVHHGVLDPGIPFIQKPFTPSQLLAKVREVLDTHAAR